jgi:Holliday junction resolvase YEN1
LFDTIRDYEESVPVAQLAEEHHRRHGKPLRIAVDEADWRFNNLTQAQVYAIRDSMYYRAYCGTILTFLGSDLAYQGQEKTMFYRICRLLTLNVQLIFVFDGPSRPWKRNGRGGGKIDYRARDLLKEVLTCFGVPYHEAPGEAEAECARLQMLGIVDAVWSQDSDCLMFGCTLWLRDDRVVKEKGTKDRSKENTQKNKKTALVVKAEDLKKIHIDREGLVLFAMLVGGDYDTKGLPGCGPSMALRAVAKGLGSSLCACKSQRDCDNWSTQLDSVLRGPGTRGIQLPIGFPAFKTLVKYNSPKVSSDDMLKKNTKLNLDLARPIKELKLLEVTSSRFNMWGRLYLNWVGPVLLTRDFINRNSSLPRELVHDIKFTKQRVKKTDDVMPPRIFERKLTFSPFGVTTLRREDFEGERLGYWNGDRTTPFDPEYRVECEAPTYWLQQVLPPDVLDPPSPPPKQPKTAQRRQQADAPEFSGSPVTTKRKRQAKEKTGAVNDLNSALSGSTSETLSKKRRQKMPASRMENVIEISDSEDELRLPAPRLSTKSSVQSAGSAIVDFGSPTSSEPESVAASRIRQVLDTPSRSRPDQTHPWSIADESENENLQLALRLSAEEHSNTSASPQKSSGPTLSRAIVGIGPRSNHQSFATLSPNKVRASHSGVQTSTGDEVNKFSSHITASLKAPDQLLAQPRPAEAPLVANSANGVPINSSANPVVVANMATRSELPTPCNVEDVRAARVRHFELLPVPTPVDDYHAMINGSSVRPYGKSGAGSHVPFGIACIDLTDD